jgi:hypothetical protein
MCDGVPRHRVSIHTRPTGLVVSQATVVVMKDRQPLPAGYSAEFTDTKGRAAWMAPRPRALRSGGKP